MVVHDPTLTSVFYSQFPEDRNEGAFTPGRDMSAALDVGASFRTGGLTVTFRPMIGWVQNGDFALAPVEVAGQPEYAYPWRTIDAPQRFGPDPFWIVDPGQSEIRYQTHGASVSLGTTNLWWGPGRQNAIIMSNNAAGFPHAALETARPLDVGIGTVEAQWIFGRLRSSDWFDPAVADPGRYITGAAVTFSPDFWDLDGLSLGASRIFYAQVPEGGIPLGEYFLIIQTPIKDNLVTPDNPTGQDLRDQMFSLFARWVLPESGFEAYAEWARNDHADNTLGYFLALGTSQAFTLGFQKAAELPNGSVLVFNGELTHLSNETDPRLPQYYAHWAVPRGYTNRGQIIGAGIGTAANSQQVGADLFARWGKASVYVRRLIRDANAQRDRSTDGELTLGSTLTLFRGPVDVVGGLERSWRFNWYFSGGSDRANLRLSLGARWRQGT